MASFAPNANDLKLFDRTLDLTNGTFYAELVTANPAGTESTVSGFTLAAGGNYARATLSGRSLATDGTGAKLAFSNPTWPGLTTNGAATIKGMIVCRQAGGSATGTDLVISYNELSSAYTPNGADFTVTIPSTGVLKLD